MKRKLEIEHGLPRPLKRRKASSSQTTSHKACDVFINFRAPDSGFTVVDCLYRSLTSCGFCVFRDDEDIRKGEVIEGELLRAISISKIYIPIFSKNYASSKWCLRELAKMIDCCEADDDKVILPIFFGVDVSKGVKLKSKAYATALQKHEDELGEIVVKPWKDALVKVARIKGWNLKDHGLKKLADLIKEKVFNKLTSRDAVPTVYDPLVGIDKKVKDIIKLLEEGSPRVRFIMIHGMGGIGKTTLVDSVFKIISSRFQGSCFLKNVRRSSSDHDMVKLQEKLLLDTLHLNFIKVYNVDNGIDLIRRRLHDRSVLIVLDDVDEQEHLLKLAAKSWFGPESRIIITTRNKEFLVPKDDKEYSYYEMRAMDYCDALQLFCQNAFKRARPPPGYYDISTEIVKTMDRIPLSLQVIGSSLHNQDVGTWKFRLEKLKEAPHKDVKGILMISYQALEYEQQQIFLDIACFFNGKKKVVPIYFWEACKLYPKIVIKILEQRSLIKVDDHENALWMHDQLSDLAKAIAQPMMLGLESQFPAKPSRLWSPERALDALRKKEVDESIVALKLGKLGANCRFVREEFARANNLKFLQLQGGNFDGDFKDVFQQLRWLSWFDCPMRLKATNLSFNNLVILKFSSSQLTEHWSGWGAFMEAKHLKVMHLEDCKRLKKTPKFSTFLGLERLVLRDCSRLEEIDGTINKLKNLNYLEISNNNVCYGQYLPEVPARSQLLPKSIGSLQSLTELKIENAGLSVLHSSIGLLSSLEILCLRCPQLGNLPDSVGKLILLEKLDLSYSGIKELPDSIGNLNRLKILRMEYSAVEYLPDTIGRLDLLEELNLYMTGITQLPETIGDLKRLKFIDVCNSKITCLPKSLVKLENLEELRAAFCRQMDGQLPEEIGKLSRLRILDLYGVTVSVPIPINQLSHLQELKLGWIHQF